jgi:hypothetical protein
MDTTEQDDRETIQHWMSRVGNGQSNRALAEDKRLNVHHQALSRWVKDNSMPADRLVALARLYNADVLEALCIGGYITKADIDRGVGVSAVRQANELDLVDELHRRAHVRAAREDAQRTGELPVQLAP